MMKRVLLLCLSFFLISLNASAQRMWEKYYEQAEASFMLGDFEEAVLLGEQAHQSAKKELSERYPANYIYALDELSAVYMQYGFSYKAIPLMEEAMQVYAKASGESPYASPQAITLGEFYEETGNYSKAATQFNQCLQYIPQKNVELRSYAEWRLARSLFSDGKNKEAEIHYKNCLTQYKTLGKKYIQEQVLIEEEMGDLYMENKNYSQAEAIYLEALGYSGKAFGKKSKEYIDILNSLGILYEINKRYPEAEQAYVECLDLFTNYYDPHHPDYTVSLFNLANLYEKMNKPVEAEHYYLQVIPNELELLSNEFPLMSDQEKEVYWTEHQKYFDRFMNFAVNQYKTSPIMASYLYDNYLVTKALLLNTSTKMRKKILESGDPELMDQFVRWQELKDSIGSMYTLDSETRDQMGVNLKSLEDQASVMEKDLSLHSEVFANFRKEFLIRWKDIKTKLKPEEAAVEIIRVPYYKNGELTDSLQYVALYLTKNSTAPQMVILSRGKSMEGKFYKYQHNCIKSQLADKKSYDIYWKPIYQAVMASNPLVKKIYLSADGVYNMMNVYTFQNPVTKKYVLEEVEVHQVSNSREILLFKLRKEVNEYQAVLFGNPNYQISGTSYAQVTSGLTRHVEGNIKIDNSILNAHYTPLPGTAIEVQNIETLLQQSRKYRWQTISYTGDKALEENVKSVTSPGILHLATHGFFISATSSTLPSNPMLRSGIVMAGVNTPKDAGRDDGILTAYEASHLYLDDTYLVVLSACESGLGDLKSGEGVYGLQRAFRLAGARTIMMSLWSVDDKATQELMSYFYGELMTQEKGLDMRLAFQRAQLKMKTKYLHPYYWGAFIMVGE